jgi:glutathione S-transferase
VLRVHRIPFSTNVERAALAAAHKGLAVEWVDHDPANRRDVRALSAQDLVPVAELDGEVVVDSMRIVERLALAPDPPLYPQSPAGRARVDLFVEWFNEVWKRPPNEICAELGRESPDVELIAALSSRMADSLDLFEGLLASSDHLPPTSSAPPTCAGSRRRPYAGSRETPAWSRALRAPRSVVPRCRRPSRAGKSSTRPRCSLWRRDTDTVCRARMSRPHDPWARRVDKRRRNPI